MVNIFDGPLDEIDLGGYDVDFLSVYRQIEEKTKYLYHAGSEDISITNKTSYNTKVYAGRGSSDNYGTIANIDIDSIKQTIDRTVANLYDSRSPDFFDKQYAKGNIIGKVYQKAEYQIDPVTVEDRLKEDMMTIANEIMEKYDNVRDVTVQYTVTRTKDDYIDTLDNHLTEERMLGHLAVQVELTRYKTDESGNVTEELVRGFAAVGTTAGAELVFDNLQKTAYEALRKAQIQLHARPLPIKEGEKIRVLMGGDVTGVFVHEMLGHMAEADSVLEGNSLGKQYGNKIAPDFVTVREIPRIEGGHGNIYYDNEIQEAKEVIILDKGVVSGFMTDRHTAVELKNKMGIDMGVTGNGRSESAYYDPMVRMRNTIMESGDTSHKEMLKKLGTGLYIVGSSGGYVYTSTGNFAVETSEAYWVENGEIMFPVETSAISGNSLQTVAKIEALGDITTTKNFVGFCGKGGWWSAQWVPVSGVGPEVLVSEMTVGETGNYARDNPMNIPEDQIDRPFEFQTFSRNGSEFGRKIVGPDTVLWW